MTIGERIQMARKKAGMKQSDLAEKLADEHVMKVMENLHIEG